MMRTFQSFGLAILVGLFQLQALAGPSFPTSPDPRLTPGSLCPRASEFRYPERIKYCNRNVDRQTKAHIIRVYDQYLGYSVGRMNRGAFKIDHLIPLCAGGSNEPDNLWPQHASVYEVTDPLEPLICEKMKAGRLRQADAVRLILEAKKDLSKVRATLLHLMGL